MVKNSKIELFRHSEYRTDAENIIKYSLFLDFKNITISPKDDNYINTIFNETNDCCKRLFSVYDSENDYKFFGTNTQNKYLDSDTFKASAFQITNFHNMLLQNSLLSCYHAILSEYLSNCHVSSYQINNLNGHGANYAYRSGVFSTKEDSLQLHKLKLRNIQKSNIDKSKAASDFNAVFQTRKEQLKNHINYLTFNDIPDDSLSTTAIKKSTNRYLIQYASICHSLRDKKATTLKTALVQHNEDVSDFSKTRELYFKRLVNGIKATTPPLQNLESIKGKRNTPFHKNAVDGIYHYYIMEKTFGLNLLYSLLKNIDAVQNRTNYRFTGKNVIETLIKFSHLPNVLSRTYFLKSAFDYVDDIKTTSYSDFWSTHCIDERKIGMKLLMQREKGFHFDKWLAQYDLFADYLSNYVIPVYDWCMLLMILNSIEFNYPQNSYLENLEIALLKISDYIESNYSTFLQPILPNIYNDELDGINIISKKNINLLIDSFTAKDLHTFHNKYYTNWNVDLNIKPLTLDYFTKNRKVNRKIIHDLYIDMLFIDPP